MNLGTEQTDRGIAALVGRMADSFSRLVSQHLTLARMELAEDAKALGLDVARIVVFVPFLLVGYLFLCGALSVALAQWIGYGRGPGGGGRRRTCWGAASASGAARVAPGSHPPE